MVGDEPVEIRLVSFFSFSLFEEGRDIDFKYDTRTAVTRALEQKRCTRVGASLFRYTLHSNTPTHNDRIDITCQGANSQVRKPA
jgi:hypothetical protein